MRPLTSAVIIALVAAPACAPKGIPPQAADAVPLSATRDRAVVERGRYLATGPAHCVGCHTPAGPLTPVDPEAPPDMVGGYAFPVPGGKVYAPNITPDAETGIGRRTDAELVLALRYGRRPDGSPLLPFMEFQGMSDEDLVAIVSFLRSRPPVPSDVRARRINVMGRLLVNLFVRAKDPAAPPPVESPDGPSVERGEYLANNVAACVGCHTRRSKTGGYKGDRFAGGYHLVNELDHARELVTPNLTPDTATGRIAGWTEDTFVSRFRLGRVIPGSPMPWSSFMHMEETDLRSIYRYLTSLPPTRHDVGPVQRDRFLPSATVGVLAGGSSYDLSGTGTSFALAGHLTWQVMPVFAIEPGITYFAYNASSTLIFPEISLQLGVPRGPFRPYLGGGIGLSIPTEGGGGTHRSLHVVAGARFPLTDALLLRGEFRVRSPQQWGSSTADYMFGLGVRLP